MKSGRLIVVVLATVTLFLVPVVAQKGGHGGGARSSSGTVHVRGYDRKDGTHVEGYDRGPHAAGETSLGELARRTAATRNTRSAALGAHATGSARPTGGLSEYSHGGIYGVTDPATGRTTFTNHPLTAAASTVAATTPSINSATTTRVTRSTSAPAVRAPTPRRSTTARPVATKSSTIGHSAQATTRRSDRCANCDRDSRGRILRSPEAKDAFMRSTGYQHGRAGYVIDHIRPLACGGADLPSNMQWQTIAAAKAKDKVERKECGK